MQKLVSKILIQLCKTKESSYSLKTGNQFICLMQTLSSFTCVESFDRT